MKLKILTVFFCICRQNITNMLNIYYNCVNNIDIMKKNDKIVSQGKTIMRIISGKAKGTKLSTLEGNETRPTLDRVKESVFNIIQNEISGSIFLDLFSGSGAIGLEAASRGATKTIMCEKSKDAINIIKRNIEKTHLEKEVTLYEGDYENILATKIKEKLDIIYIDPPYKTNYATKTVQLLIKEQLLKSDSIVIIETDIPEEVLTKLEQIGQMQVTDIRKYGRATIIVLQTKEPN